MTIADSRLKLTALILVFFGPLLLAMLIYFNPQWFTVPGSASHGELITPAQPLAAFEAVSREGRTLPGDLLSGRWTLLYWNGAGCGLPCEAALFKMRQVRLSLGKDIQRVQTVYLASEVGDGDGGGLQHLLDRHPRLLVAYSEAYSGAHSETGESGGFLKQISAHPQGSIYVIDPLGNLMMRYPDAATSKGMLKDLKKLLRVSRIG